MQEIQQRVPVLADAAAVLSGHLRRQLRDFAAVVAPLEARVGRLFVRQLRGQGYTAEQIEALVAITPARTAALLEGDGSLAALVEQAEYCGRRLAKLGLRPPAVVGVLRDYEGLLNEFLRSRPETERANLAWVRDQLQFAMVLSLNNAYYQVREQESDTFYKLFRAELEAANLDDMLRRFRTVLQEYTGADEARVSLEVPARGAARRWLAEPRCGAVEKVPAELGWPRRFRTVWSVPLAQGTAGGGVMQFGFRAEYAWLPRERELLVAAAERCRRAAEKALLLANLAEREEQIRQLAGHMVEVEESERRRISRELHDEAGQSLLCVRLQLEVLENAPGRDTETRRKLAETRATVEHSIIEIRRLIAALSPAVLEQIGLAAALRQLVGRFRRVHPAVVHLKVPRRLDLSKKVEIIVYRLAQECLQNAAKYSQAQNVNLSVHSADGHLRMRIADDGVGFDVEEAFSRRNCYGLSGLRERVTLLGGSLAVTSRRAAVVAARGGVRAAQGRCREAQVQGTAIDISLPLGGLAARGAQNNNKTAQKTARRATLRRRVGS